MLDGLKVVILALLLSGFALLAAHLIPESEPDRLSCVTGEAARNVTMKAPDGHTVTIPRHQDFDSIAEAENWICLNVPQAEVLPGWQIAHISAHRPRSVGVNNGTRSSLFIEYRNPQLGASVHLETPGPVESLGQGTPQAIEIGGVEGTVWFVSDPAFFSVQWGQGDDAVMASDYLAAGVDFWRHILPLLESVH
jgi:hypothetical protein